MDGNIDLALKGEDCDEHKPENAETDFSKYNFSNETEIKKNEFRE